MSREDFEPLAWARKGVSRREAERWWDGGFSLAEAARWFERFDPEEAIAWRAAGVTSPAEARAWRVAGVGENEVAGWRDAGMGFAEAAAWHEFEYSLEEAKQLKAEGKTPSEAFRRQVEQMPSQPRPTPGAGSGFSRMLGGSGVSGPAVSRLIAKLRNQPMLIQGYLGRQWFDDEALAWADQGMEAADAMAWKELGLSPTEAKRLADAGQTPAGTMREWWQAGIPFDEVAAWLGAGLSPAEAAEHRARGISPERAAVMRALRDPDE